MRTAILLLLSVSSLAAAPAYFLDSQPMAPYPLNPCLTCDTSTNEDGSIQVHDVFQAMFMSSSSYHTRESVNPYPESGHVRIVFTGTPAPTLPGNECLTTNGYGAHFGEFWSGGLPIAGWDTSTNFEWDFTMGEGYIQLGNQLSFDYLFPTMQNYDIVKIECYANFVSGTHGYCYGTLDQRAGYTTLWMGWALTIEPSHDFMVLDMTPQSYQNKMPLCHPTVAIFNNHDGTANIVTGGYEGVTDYNVRKLSSIFNWGVGTQIIGTLSTDPVGYGQLTVGTSDLGTAFFQVVP